MGEHGCIRGRQAHVKWHDYNAATIEKFVVTRSGAQWRAEGFVVVRDAFKLSMRPLVFVAPWTIRATATKPERKGHWTWPVLTFAIADSGRLTAQLAPPLNMDYALPTRTPDDGTIALR